MLTSAVKINFDIVEQNNFHDEGLVFRILAGAIMGIASKVNKQEQITQLQQQYGDIEQQYNQLENKRMDTVGSFHPVWKVMGGSVC